MNPTVLQAKDSLSVQAKCQLDSRITAQRENPCFEVAEPQPKEAIFTGVRNVSRCQKEWSFIWFHQ